MKSNTPFTSAYSILAGPMIDNCCLPLEVEKEVEAMDKPFWPISSPNTILVLPIFSWL
jgi:hypothetical protein